MSEHACRGCGEALRETFVDLGCQPLANSYLTTAQLDEMEPFLPLHVRVCARCFLVQLPAMQTPEAIFGDYAYFSSFSEGWLRHARAFASDAVAGFGLSEDSMVVEVASNDGYLLQYFVEQGIPVLGVEPAANVAAAAVERGVPTRVAFFGAETARSLLAEGHAADLIIANNVLAHVPDIADFVAGLSMLLKPLGTITLEFPHVMELMRNRQFDTIYHEHFSYLSLLALEPILAAHGLAVAHVERLATHGGSLRVHVRHADDVAVVSEAVDTLRSDERAARLDDLAAYGDFAGEVAAVKRDLLTFLIEAAREGKKVAGYGAPAKGNTLLNFCGVRTDLLPYTVDLSPHKQGLHLPGVHIPVRAPEAIAVDRPDYILILPWNLRDEIVEQMGSAREWGCRFVVPIPRLEIID